MVDPSLPTEIQHSALLGVNHDPNRRARPEPRRKGLTNQLIYYTMLEQYVEKTITKIQGEPEESEAYMWLWKKLEPKRGQILVLIDFDNIMLNLDVPPESFSLTEGFDRLIQELGKVGDIMEIFVFAPPQTALAHLETFHKHGFFTIPCPRVKDKTCVARDTVDATLMEYGRKRIARMQAGDYLCIGSGDKDFIPLVRRAIGHGLKIIIVAGNINSLASELIGFVDKHPILPKKMVFFFTPTRT